MFKTLSVLALFVSAGAQAAMITSAKLDSAKKNIIIEGRTGGGCGKHDFSLNLGACMETFPVQCKAELVEHTDDACEAIIPVSAVISLAKYKLNDPYYKGGSLTITGDANTSATVKLP
jgi:hypothetical protein